MIDNTELNLGKLRFFAKMGPNWNGYSSDPILYASIDIAKNVITHTKHKNFEVFPLADGRIQLEICIEGNDVEIIIGTEKLEITVYDGKSADISDCIIKKYHDIKNHIVRKYEYVPEKPWIASMYSALVLSATSERVFDGVDAVPAYIDEVLDGLGVRDVERR